MNDERVDEVLADLDRALSVQPSASAIARVRTTIAARPRRRARWLYAAATMAAIGAIVVVTYQGIEHPNVQELKSPDVQGVRAAAVQEGKGPDVPQVEDARAQGSTRSTLRGPDDRRVERSARTSDVMFGEPEILISPEVRAAYEQLRAGMAAGRITAASFEASRSVDIAPPTIVPTIIVIQPFGPLDDEAFQPNQGGNGRENERGVDDDFRPPTRPLSRTGRRL